MAKQNTKVWVPEGAMGGGAGDLLGRKLTNLILNLDIQWHMFHRSVKTDTQVWIINVGDLDFELSPWKKVEASLSKKQGLAESNSQGKRTAIRGI